MKPHTSEANSAFQFLRYLFHQIGLVRLALAALIITLCDIGICSQPFILARIMRHQTVDYRMLLLFAVTLLLPVVANFITSFLVQMVRKYSKLTVFHFLTRQRYEYFLGYKDATLESIVNEISLSLRRIVHDVLNNLLKSTITLVVYAIALATINAFLGSGYIILFILYLLGSILLSRQNKKGIKYALNSKIVADQQLDDYLKNKNTVYSYRSFAFEGDAYQQVLENERQAYSGVQGRIDRLNMAQQFLLTLCVILLFGWGSMVTRGTVQAITLILVMVYSIMNLSHFGSDLLAGMELFGRLVEALRQLNFNMTDLNQSSSVKQGEMAEIRLQNVSYQYKKGEPLLDGYNARFPLNASSVLVGVNGAGKSTILKLLAGILTPIKGSVLIPQQAKVTYVNQDAVLFNRSIYDNITYMNSEVDEQQVVKMMRYFDFSPKIISKFKVQTSGELINSLSGGERQKCLIIRALLSSANVILFDEITSGLDQEATRKFFKLLQKYQPSKTFICITHRENELGYFEYQVQV